MYALLHPAADGGMRARVRVLRGSNPVTEFEYEMGASGAATKAILKGGAKGAALGALGGPVGALIGFVAGAIIFGEPEVIERDRKYNEECERRRR